MSMAFRLMRSVSARKLRMGDMAFEVDGPRQAPVPDDAAVARRLRRVEAWGRSKLGGQMLGSQPRRRSSWYSDVPNMMGPPVDRVAETR